MATGTRICKICGKEYACCKTLRVVEGVFRWQDVACCVEHGQQYLDLIMISRGEKKQTPESEAIVSTNEPEVVTQKPKATRRKRKVEE